jgi:hypothetical protein
VVKTLLLLTHRGAGSSARTLTFVIHGFSGPTAVPDLN